MRWLIRIALALLLPAALGRGAETGGKIVYSRKDGDRVILHVMNADGTGDRELPGLIAAVNLFPSWSPDGKKIAFTSGRTLGKADRDYQACVINVDGTGLQTLNVPHPMAAFPVWSHDGKRLALAAGEQYEELSIYTSDPDGNNLQPLKDSKSGVFPFWSHDDATIGYSRIGNQGKADLVLAKADGSGEELLFMDKDAGAGGGGFSGDGKKLLFITLDFDTAKITLGLWDFSAKSEQTLNESNADGLWWQGLPMPCWEGSGKSLLMVQPTDKGHGVFRLSEEGKTITRLTPEGVDCLQADWTDKS